MKKLLPFLAPRQFLAFLSLIVISLVIWFVGPFVAYGGLKPLAGAGMRALLIALLAAGAVLWLAERSLSAVLMALLCTLIWYASPLLSFGHAALFEPVSARLTAIGLLVGAFVVYWLFRLRRWMREDELFLKKLLYFGSKQEESPAASRLGDVDAIVAGALARLRSMRTGAYGLAKLFQGKRYLYEVPWFITLGSNGSGKTSALLNGGLSFPVAERMQQSAGVQRGEAAALNWRLTNEAVLIDTAGYYTRHGTSLVQDVDEDGKEQNMRAANEAGDATAGSGDAKADGSLGNAPAAVSDADAKVEGARRNADAPASASRITSVSRGRTPRADRREIDSAEWLGFLRTLRQRRPRAPVNGALVFVDLASLTSDDENVRGAEAVALHARLTEMREQLGIRFPVYLIVTKMDRMTGFSDYVGALTSEGRSQTWGFTLAQGKKAVAKEGLRARCFDELNQLAGRLAAVRDTRLGDEYDASKRGRIRTLSQEFAAIVSPLVDLIERAFLDPRYDTTELHSSLRGVYFASALQADSEIVAERRSVAQRLASTQEEKDRAVAVQRQEGRQSYFLHDLFKRVIFPESHLVTPNLRWEHRSRLARLLAHTLVIAFFAWLAMGLYLSFGHNQTYAEAIGAKARPLAARVAQLYKEPKPQAVPDTLTEARDLPTFPGLSLSDPGTSWRYGLYTAPNIVAESRRTYDALEDRL
ncbi:MAG TPA: type VI secretion protein IcmF/TssM N-terminal domain-containing protein, partial [Trinickia sp.]|uniref:type VI secretion protein IcmF/TssM N-terminal domain-containing protein n=1 Tax=Trinickia sp. TaxID=2571163 RepID=UPI002CC806DC